LESFELTMTKFLARQGNPDAAASDAADAADATDATADDSNPYMSPIQSAKNRITMLKFNNIFVSKNMNEHKMY